MKPIEQDDLTRIRGLSSKAAQRLGEAGIRTYAGLASLSPDKIVARLGADSGVTVEHIVKRDWIGQATRLAAKPTEERGLRATSYIVELFLDATNRVKGTKVHHVQSLDEEAWEDWDEARLLAFFTRRPELRLAPAAEAPVADEATATSAAPVLAPNTEVPVEGPPPATPGGA
jgi:hypothetical protein